MASNTWIGTNDEAALSERVIVTLKELEGEIAIDFCCKKEKLAFRVDCCGRSPKNSGQLDRISWLGLSFLLSWWSTWYKNVG